MGQFLKVLKKRLNERFVGISEKYHKKENFPETVLYIFLHTLLLDKS